MHRQESWVDRQKTRPCYPLLLPTHTRLSNTRAWVDTSGREMMTINTYFTCDGQSIRFDADNKYCFRQSIELVQFEILPHG